MSAAIITKDTATPLLQELVARIAPGRLGAVLGRAGANLIKRHLETLPSNRRGWPTTGFWKEASRSTSHAATSNGAVITINKQGFRQRLQGGVIRRVKAGALAIPARAEAYGRLPREFDNLTLGRGIAEDGKEGFGLVETKRTDIKIGKRGVKPLRTHLGNRLMFYLTGSVKQAANPNVLPSDEKFFDALRDELGRALPR